MPPTRSHIRKLVTAYLDRHLGERPALRPLLEDLDPEGIDLVHLVHSQHSPTARPRIQLFFQARSWSGVSRVLEPDRCAEWRWFNPKDLPDNTVPYARQAIEAILAGRPYSAMGWTR